MNKGKINLFGKLGRLIAKRKYAITAGWILLLAIILPIALTASGVASLTMNSSTDSNLESAKASNIITAQFQKTVSNDSLIIIISTDNASSISTQRFIDQLVTQINENSSITGIENITSVYSILVPALNQTNQGVYLAYNSGNLTYNLLYSVPTIYSNVWYQAYNQTKNGSLVLGLSQTNQAIYAVIDNANMTYNLLYGVPTMYTTVWSTAYNQTRDALVAGLYQTNQGVYTTLENANLTYNLLYGTPAIYLNIWTQAYSQTQDINQSNQIAYQQTAAALQQADPVSYIQYTSHLLDAFNTSWTLSFQDPETQAYTPIQRATAASDQTNQLYINTFLAGNATNQAFVSTLANTLSLSDFLTNNQIQNNAELAEFSIQYVTNSSGGASSTEFVSAAHNLGVNPSAAALSSLAENIIRNPDSYQMGTNFISTFNDASYSQRCIIQSKRNYFIPS